MNRPQPLRYAVQAPLTAGNLAVLLAIAAGVWLVARLGQVILMAFGAVLIAVLLNAIAEPIRNRLKLGRLQALTAATVLIGAAVAAVVWAFGRQAEAQLSGLSVLLGHAWTSLHQQLAGSPLGGLVLREMDTAAASHSWALQLGPRLATDLAGSLVGGVIILFAGLYIGYHPSSYAGGLLLLFPRALRGKAAAVLDKLHLALKQWLVGQVASMILVAVTATLGLWVAGVPSPLALGIIAGLGHAVPVVGPIAATVPGLLAGLTVSPETAIWAGVVYFAAAQLETNVITPLMLRQMVQLPMAVTLFAVLAMGALLGPLGVLFATPLAVVCYVFIKTVYVEGVLGERAAPAVVPAEKRA